MKVSARAWAVGSIRGAGLLWALGLSACRLDERQLELETASGGHAGSSATRPSSGGSSGAASGGAGAGGSGGGTGGNLPSDAGAAGASDEAPVLVAGCADLDGNQISDCSETLVKNAEFASDVSQWAAESAAGDSFTTELDWDSANAWGTGSMGCANIRVSGMIDFNGNAVRGATQCVAVSASQLLVVYANTRIDADQDANAGAEVDVSFFDTTDCTGVATTSFATPQPPEASMGHWLTVHAGAVGTVSTRSALVKLGVVKPFRASDVTARFDNVLVRVQSP